MEHGELRSYKKGCRCDKCLDTGRAYNRARRRVSPRLPIDPLLKVMPPEWRSSHHKSIVTWQRTGITVFHADKLCCGFGYHPWTVYGDLWFKELWERHE